MTPAAKRSRCAWLGRLAGTEMFRAALESVHVVSERLVTCLADASSANSRANRDALMFTGNLLRLRKGSAKLLGKQGQAFARLLYGQPQ